MSDKGSRPGSGRRSASGSRPASVSKSTTESRPPSVSKPAADSRPASVAKSTAESRPVSVAKSTADSRPASVEKSTADSRPASVAKSAADSRPASVAKSTADSRPMSVEKSTADSRPASVAKSAADSRPASVAKSTADSRPASGSRPPSGARPGSITRSASDARPESAIRPASTSREMENMGEMEEQQRSVAGSRASSTAGSRPPSGSSGSRHVDKNVNMSNRKKKIEPSDDPATIAEPEEPDDPLEYFGETIDEPQQYPPMSEPATDVPAGTTAETEKAAHEYKGPFINRDIYPLDYEGPFVGQPPDDDGDDSGGSDDDGGELEPVEDQGEEEGEEEEAEQELVVLDPDHSLMIRYQKRLKKQQEREREHITLQLRDLTESIKRARLERENIGVELYGVQQELAKFQMALEKLHDEYSSVVQTREQKEAEVEKMRKFFAERRETADSEKRRAETLQAELQNINLRLHYMDNAKTDVRGDIAVMQRAAEKADLEVQKAEVLKQQQDLFVDRLVERVDKLREEIAMYDAQIIAQTEETREAKEALTDAQMEVEAINLEKKHIYAQWCSSVIGMKRRDETHAAMTAALDDLKQRIISLECELEGLKKSIQKEQKMNEKLTHILNKTEADIATVKKMLAACQERFDALKNKYSINSRILHETETALSKAMMEKTLHLNELTQLQKDIERAYQEKVRLEDEIMEKMREQISLDKASEYTEKMTRKLRERTKRLEIQSAEAENDIAKSLLDMSNCNSKIEALQRTLNELDEEMKQKNEIVAKSDQQIARRNALIERKQGELDKLNKKLEALVAQSGGQELGPLEIAINSFQKSIAEEQHAIAELQQSWLRDQDELVRISKEEDEQSQEMEMLNKKLMILTQKKLRMEGEIKGQNLDIKELERSITTLRNDMKKMNELLYKERGTENILQQDNVIMETEFMGALKDAERESIQLQERLDAMKEEKESLLNSLIEAERQIMLWEKKIQLARETRDAVNKDIGQGEVHAMKTEIHRMECRYAQLMKQQEKMIQDMERSVERRDSIMIKGEAESAKSSGKVVTKGTFHRQMADLRKKIKQTIQDASECDHEIATLRDDQQQLSRQLDERQLSVQQLQSTIDGLDGDVDRLAEAKQKELVDIVAKQQRAKYYQQLKEGKYARICKTAEALETEHSKQINKMQITVAIVDRLCQEFPHAQQALRKVIYAFGSRDITPKY